MARPCAGSGESTHMGATSAHHNQSTGQLLARTPYVLWMSTPGVNVVSAADFAGEMGPSEHYANARAITDTRTPDELLDLIEAKGHEVAGALALLRVVAPGRDLLGAQHQRRHYRLGGLRRRAGRERRHEVLAG